MSQKFARAQQQATPKPQQQQQHQHQNYNNNNFVKLLFAKKICHDMQPTSRDVRDVPVSADDDLSPFALALHFDPEPLAVFDLRRNWRVQLRQGPVVDAVIAARQV